MDGPVGTQLDRCGIWIGGDDWSAAALREAPGVVQQIHRDYALAGAVVHTANTFRTKRRNAGSDWETLTRTAIELARRGAESVSVECQIAGSIAPLADCYRPDLSPNNSYPEHAELAHVLADAGCDLLLCETFPNVAEAVQAVAACAETKVETWVSFTAGPSSNLLNPSQIVEGARETIEVGARAVLVNCIPASDTLRFVKALAKANLPVPIGAYANAGMSPDGHRWNSDEASDPHQYALFARQWRDAGATIIGACCGTGPDHIEACCQELD